MNRSLFTSAIALVLAVCTAMPARAQLYTPEQAATFRMSTFGTAVRPMAGVYYDMSQSGTGLTLDTAPVGDQIFFFGTYYHYTTGGQATWLNMGKLITQRTVAQYLVDGVPAVVTGQWDRAANGQCMDCPFVPVVVTQETQLGERSLLVLGARHIQKPPQGLAAAWNAMLSRDLGTGRLKRVIEDPMVVWSLQERYPTGDIFKRAWHRFVKRTPSQSLPKIEFLSYNDTNITNGQGGVMPSTMPAWFDGPSRNTADHYESHCVFQEGSQTTGLCPNSLTAVTEPLGGTADDFGTWFIEPGTNTVRYAQICGFLQRDICGTRVYRKGTISAVGDAIELEGDSRGVTKFALRYYDRLTDALSKEFIFTRVDQSLVLEKIPNFTATIP